MADGVRIYFWTSIFYNSFKQVQFWTSIFDNSSMRVQLLDHETVQYGWWDENSDGKWNLNDCWLECVFKLDLTNMVLYCSYYWTSIKPVNWTAILAATQSNQSTGQPSWLSLNQTSKLDSHPGSHSIDGDGGGDGGFPRTLESGRSPGPTCPGTKYPVRGIPHFDVMRIHSQ